ncbi:MAG: protein-L-isoaspartate(D-aspartate) O-methyltransferase [Alphaproteobacteria bacterium]|nr:protein-L-isoaspartate(D-aspartate) O-methyltransferase [Alphaproteobacteria bacterium]
MTPDSLKIRLLMELRGLGVTETRVLAAIERIPRDIFVPDAFKQKAYDDVALPIGQGQTISRPSVVALMTQALRLDHRSKVLEIGTGSGYHTAVLSRLCRRVYTVERSRALLTEAEQRFRDLRIHNVTARHGDGADGWPAQAPFASIVVTAASAGPPAPLVDQLAIGGRLVIPIGGQGQVPEVTMITRLEGGFREEVLMTARFVPLISEVETLA